MKRIILLILSVYLSCIIAFAEDESFVDVSEEDWFSYDVTKLKSQDYVKGFPDGTFRPNNNISVEEFITITIKVVGESEASINKVRWSDGFIKRALELGYVINGEFDNYQRDITRGEMSRMILRASELTVPDNYKEFSTMIVDFSDMDDYWQDIALRVYTTGIIGGFPDGSFVLNGEATRAQACAILNKLLEPGRRYPPELVSKSQFEERVSYLRHKWSLLKPTYTGDPFVIEPRITAPYSIGEVNELFINDAVNTLKYIRIIAGLSDTIYASEAANTYAQHGALLNAVSEFSHTPPKPSDMEEEFYNIAYEGTSTSNLAVGNRTLSKAVEYLMADADVSNIDRVGHRRWFLLPKLNEVGFGHVKADSTWRHFSVMKVFRDLTVIEASYESVLWPSELAFPTEFFLSDTPWTAILNPTIYDRSKTSEINVTLTRINDNKVWTFDWSDTDKSGKYFNVETNYYAVPFCIIFRPLLVGEKYSSGDVFNVKIDGLYTHDGEKTTFEYDVEFFNIAE